MNDVMLVVLAGETSRAQRLVEALNREAELQESGCPDLCPQEQAELFQATVRLAAALGPKHA